MCGTVKAKGTNQDNQDKEKITENVQRENKVRTSGNKKKKNPGRDDIFRVSKSCRPALRPTKPPRISKGLFREGKVAGAWP